MSRHLDSIILVVGALWMGAIIWGLGHWMKEESACARLEAAAQEKRAEREAEAKARAEREAYIARWKNENPKLARILDTQWNGRRQP